jgi:hypothetical protein
MPAISTTNRKRARTSITDVFAKKNGGCPVTLSVVSNMMNLSPGQQKDHTVVDLDKFTPALLDRVYKYLQNPEAPPAMTLGTRQKLAMALLDCPPELYQELRVLATTPDHEFDFGRLSPLDLARLRSGTTVLARLKRLRNKMMRTVPKVREQIMSALVAGGLCLSLEELMDLKTISEDNLRIFQDVLETKCLDDHEESSSSSSDDDEDQEEK